MNGKSIAFLFFIVLPNALFAQAFDAVWPMGTNEFSNTGGYGNAIVRFKDDSVFVEKADLRMNFESTVSAISDSLGNLLFYTNGCYIATASTDTMPNGEGLNPGAIHEWVCPENGYISHRGAMILPMPGSNHLFYILHMGVRYDAAKKLEGGPFYYSVVDMALNNGQGAVSSKNNALTDGNLEPFTVTRHGNGRDWWILIPERNSNHYRRFLLNPYGVFEQATIEVGEAANCMRVGSSIFSMDGRRFARQQNCKTIVFDFDRCNGVLTNPLELSTPDYSFGGGGVAFSPDGSHLFCTTQMAILSANLQTPTPKFDTLVNTEAITGAGLHYMQYAPNGKQIYISILHRSLFFSSLDSLNSIKPIYNQKALSFPVYTVRSLPNFPNYRLYDLPNSPCDTLGINTPVSASEPTSIEQNRLILYPNPATDKIQIKLPKSWHGKINIALTNTFGQLVHSETMDAGNGQLFLPLVSLPNGLYVCWAASVGEVPLSMVFAVMR